MSRNYRSELQRTAKNRGLSAIRCSERRRDFETVVRRSKFRNLDRNASRVSSELCSLAFDGHLNFVSCLYVTDLRHRPSPRFGGTISATEDYKSWMHFCAT